jgi:CMP-N-acetylneuraminic acid synthetase
MHITALLTGRGNNTLTDKNVLPVLGRPLLHYIASAARACPLVDSFFVSSDDDKILTEAGKLGYTPIRRPAELALPNSQHVDAIRHALDVMAQQDVHPDILVVLLANVGTVKPSWVHDCIQALVDDPSLSAVVPAHIEMDHHPFRAKRVDEDGLLQPFFDFSGKRISTNRQDLPTCMFLDHSFWVLRVATSIRATDGQQPWSFMGSRIKPFVTDGAFDVHTRDDLDLTAKWLIANGLATGPAE